MLSSRWLKTLPLTFGLLLAPLPALAVFQCNTDTLIFDEGQGAPQNQVDVFANDFISGGGPVVTALFDAFNNGNGTLGPAAPNNGVLQFDTNLGASGNEAFIYLGQTTSPPIETCSNGNGVLFIGINPVAGAPLVTASDVTGDEDTVIPLNLSVALNTALDPDGSEQIIDVLLGGVPGGATLSAGTDLGGGVFRFTPGQLAGLTLTPAPGFSGNIALTLRGVVEDSATIINTVSAFQFVTDQAQTDVAFTVTVNPVAVPPTVVANDVSGDEDTAIPLDITVTPEPDGSDTITRIVISPVPTDVTLSAGTVNGTEVTVTPAQLTGLTLTPAPGFSGTIPLNVQATATDGTSSAIGSGSFVVTVNPVAEMPTLTANDVSGDEDTAIPLDVTAAANDPDGSDVLREVILSGFPAGSTVSGANDLGGGVFRVSGGNFAGVSAQLASGLSGTFSIDVEAVAEDAPATASTFGSFTLDVAPVADTPQITANDVSGNEDTTIALNLAVATNPSDADGSESISRVEITGVPAGFTLTNALDLGSGRWGVAPAAVGSVGLTPPTNFVGTVPLGIEADTLDQVGARSSTATASASFNVDVNNVNDPPQVGAPIADVSVNEDAGPVSVNLASAFTDADIPIGDVLSYAITNVVVVATTNPIASSSASGDVLTIQLGQDKNGQVDVTVTATDTAGASADQTFRLTVAPVNDPPSINAPIADVTANEDTPPIGISLTGRYSDPDSINGDTATVTAVTSDDPALVAAVLTSPTELQLSVPANAFGATTVRVTIDDTQGNSVEDAFTVTINAVNDAPRLVVPLSDIQVQEDSGPAQRDLNVNFEDVDNPDSELIFNVTNDTPGLFSVFSVSAGVLSFTPAPNMAGVANVSVAVEDPAGLTTSPAVETFTITVTDVNDPPFVATPLATPLTVNEDAPPITLALGPVFDDPDLATNPGESLTLTVATSDGVPVIQSAVISGTNLQITLEPNANHDFNNDGVPDGSALVTVTATDAGGLSVDNTFELIVQPQNDTPVANDDTATTPEDPAQPLPILVLANDVDQDAPITLTLADGSLTGPSDGTSTIINALGDPVTVNNGTVTVDQTAGTISYLPRQDFNGTDFFQYRIQDVDGEVDFGTVAVTVTPVNDPPVGTPLLQFQIVANTSLTQVAPGVLLNATDPDGDDIDVDLLTPPANGSLNLDSATGEFTYVPDVNFVGVDSFTYRITDNVAFNTGGAYTVEITVTAAPPPPAPPPPGQVEFDFNLAKTPLEEAIGAEANVLVVMDDSGSMDWTMMNPEPDGRFNLTGGTSTTGYSYLYTLSTNTYSTTSSAGRTLPSQEAVDADPDFAGNNFGVWRARTARYNTIYYDPEVHYTPWIGLDPNGQEYADVDPTQAPLDVTQFDPANQSTYIDLTQPVTYVADNVPTANSQEQCIDFGFFIFCFPGAGKDLTVSNYYIPRYYTSTDPDPLAFDSQHTLVEIRDANTDGDNNPATNPTIFPGSLDRIDCAVDDNDPLTCTLDQELQNFANWFSYYRSREYVAKASLGSVVSDSFNLRIGYATLNNPNAREPIASMNASFRTGEKRQLLDQVYVISSNGGTPLRDALDKAGRHFECKSGDSFGSSGNSSPGDPGCPVFAAPEGQCQNNFTLLFTDGFWNGGGPSQDRDGPGNGDTAFDGGVFADNRGGTLADVAMHYYERDLHPSLADAVATTERDLLYAPVGSFGPDDETMHQHMKTYTIGFGVDGLLTDADIPASWDAVLPPGFDWGDPFSSALAKIDDLRHAALNGRGLYLAGNNSTLLAEAFRGAFNDFTRGSTSVSAVSLNSNELDTDTVRFRASFNLKLKTGEISAFLLDANGDAIPPAIWQASEQLDAISPSARTLITSSNDATTGIDTGIPFRFGTTPGVDGLDANQLAVLSEDEINYIRGDRSNERPTGVLRERPETNGLLGDFVHSDPIFVGVPAALERDQAPFPTDDLYSDFVAAQANRLPVLYAGANDGILHGFNAETGDEVIGYIPNKLIDIREQFRNELSQVTSPTYGHEYFVDLTPAVSDVYMFPRKNALTKSWNTVLLGGFEAGAKGYFLLNVTDPANFSEANADDIVLWEFTDSDDTDPSGGTRVDLAGNPVKDLGYSFSEATLQMSNVVAPDGQQEWIAVFGNGYNSTEGVAKLFVLFLDRGLDGWGDPGDFVKLDTGFGVQAPPHPKAGLPNGLGTPALIDKDGNGTVDLAYAGDLLGNLFRFDISDPDPANWTVTRLFTATYTDPVTGNEIPQPITQKPLVRKHPTEDSGFLVVFGTGSFITEDDGVSTDIQSVYGIWDRLIQGATPDTAAADAKQTKLVQQFMTKAVVNVGGVERTVRLLTSNPVDYSVQAGANRKFGYYFNLDVVRPLTKADGTPNDDVSGNPPPDPQFPGERAIRRFILRNDFVTTSTVIPRSANSCLRAPPGAIINFDLAGGGDPKGPVLDLDNDLVVDQNDIITVDGVQYAGAGLEFGVNDLDGTLVDLTILGDAGSDILFVSGGEDTTGIRITRTVDSKTGRLTWRELD